MEGRKGRHAGQMNKKLRIVITYGGWKPGIWGAKKEGSLTLLCLFSFLAFKPHESIACSRNKI